MPWSKNSGKGGWNQGGNQGPWGGPPPGGGSGGGRKGGDHPPDLEQILRRGQERLRKILPAGAPGGSAFGIGAALVFLIWMASGFYQVGASQEGVVLRFGRFANITPPGLQWRLPWPIETHRIVRKTDAQQVTIGGQPALDQTDPGVGSADEGLMLTGDRNFLNVKFVVQFNVKDSREFLFNVNDPRSVVRTSAQSAMREVVGRGNFDQLQTEQRGATAEEVRRRTQAALDSYHAGIEIIQVNIDSVDPPDKALEAARDVQTARQEKETMRNQAEAYQNKVVPQARGQAQRIQQAAEAYKQKVIADAQGETARFLSVYEQYKKAPDVTRRRMYLETMEGILGGMNKVVIDRSAQGVVPYLPLSELGRSSAKSGEPSNPPAGPAAGGH